MKNLNKLLKKLPESDQERLVKKFKAEAKRVKKLNKIEAYLENLILDVKELKVMKVNVYRDDKYAKIHFGSDLRRNFGNEDLFREDLKELTRLIEKIDVNYLPGGVSYERFDDRKYNVYGYFVHIDEIE